MRLGYLTVKSPNATIAFDLMTASGEDSSNVNNNLKCLSHNLELEGRRGRRERERGGK